MIEKQKIILLLNEWLNEEQFVVDVKISQDNQICIVLDSDKGLNINDCVSASKYVESHLDREKEDFELMIISAGINQPLKFPRQYIKNIGKKMDVKLSDGQKFTGILKAADDNGFDIETASKEKIEGKKNKQMVTRLHNFSYEEIKTVKNSLKY